jgi:hypothetical protein
MLPASQDALPPWRSPSWHPQHRPKPIVPRSITMTNGKYVAPWSGRRRQAAQASRIKTRGNYAAPKRAGGKAMQNLDAEAMDTLGELIGNMAVGDAIQIFKDANGMWCIITAISGVVQVGQGSTPQLAWDAAN